MRDVEDLRNTQKEEIWIIGCGFSLEVFPDDFFDKKVSIAVNAALIAFSSPIYINIYHKHYVDFIKNHQPQLFKKCILLWPFEGISSKNWFGEYTDDIIWMNQRTTPANKEEFEQATKDIIEGKPCQYPHTNTIIHFAIQAAVVMGARKITLVGCEHRPAGTIHHAQTRGMGLLCKKHLTPQHIARMKKGILYEQMEKGTVWLAEALQDYDIALMRFFYPKGYEKII